MRSLRLALLLSSTLLCPLAQAAEHYDAAYRARIRPQAGIMEVEITLSGERLPSRLVLHVDPRRHRSFSSNDPLEVERTQVTWRPRGRSARLKYEFVVNHERSPKRYDSLMTKNWAVFRSDKLVPRISVTAPKSLHSRATLEIEAPEGWTAAAPYPSTAAMRYTIEDPTRRFDRPRGWMIAGRIGTRGDRINGRIITVAAPTGGSVRRQDMVAFLNWTVPRLLHVFPDFPERLLIVSAGDPMWRGGLSGPSSMFLHADRPLISENRTSTLLHEIVHIAMGIRADEESDWIVEGFAEFYSIEALRRSGTISDRRYRQALGRLASWARRAPTLFEERSSGPVTARAVLTLHAVDAEIRRVTRGTASLDHVARKLAEKRGKVSLARLRSVAEEVAGKPLDSLERAALMKRPAVPSP